MKKISALLIAIALVVTVGIIAGCSSSTTKEAPPLPGKKKSQLPPTYLDKDATPETYLKSYYTLYAEKKFKEAYKMLPAGKKDSQKFEEYEQMHKSMPLKSFDVGTKQDKGDDTVIDVTLQLEQYGEWHSTWTFVKDKKGYYS